MTVSSASNTPAPPQEWKAKANAEYQKVMSSIITLSTATLVLPTLFLKDFLGVVGGTPLMPRLTFSVYASWLSLFLAIVSALSFYFLSAKWLKQAYGGPVSLSERCIERALDIMFWASIFTFALGLVLLLWFMASAASGSAA